MKSWRQRDEAQGGNTREKEGADRLTVIANLRLFPPGSCLDFQRALRNSRGLAQANLQARADDYDLTQGTFIGSRVSAQKHSFDLTGGELPSVAMR